MKSIFSWKSRLLHIVGVFVLLNLLLCSLFLPRLPSTELTLSLHADAPCSIKLYYLDGSSDFSENNSRLVSYSLPGRRERLCFTLPAAALGKTLRLTFVTPASGTSITLNRLGVDTAFRRFRCDGTTFAKSIFAKADIRFTTANRNAIFVNEARESIVLFKLPPQAMSLSSYSLFALLCTQLAALLLCVGLFAGKYAPTVWCWMRRGGFVLLGLAVSGSGLYFCGMDSYPGVVLFSFIMVALCIWSSMFAFETIRFRGLITLYLLLAVGIIIVLLPALYSPYAVYDEWPLLYCFGSSETVSFGIAQARCITGSYMNMFRGIDYESMRYLRLPNVIWMILTAMLILGFLLRHIRCRVTACSAAVIFVFLSQGLDCFLYGITPVWFGLYCATASYLLLHRVFIAPGTWGRRRFWLLLPAICCLIGTLLTYQACICMLPALHGTAILLEPRKSFWKSTLQIGGVVLAAGICYLVFSRFAVILSGIELMSRSAVISDFRDLWAKCVWFAGTVLPENGKHILLTFGGFDLSSARRDGVMQLPLSPSLLVFPALLLVSGLIREVIMGRKTTDRLCNCIILLCCLPGAYLPFLLLRENGQISYYAYGLAFILAALMLYGLVGWCHIFERLSHVRSHSLLVFCLPALALLATIQGANYMRRAVAFHRDEFNLLCKSVEELPAGKVHLSGGRAWAPSVFRTAVHRVSRSMSEFQVTHSEPDNIHILVLDKSARKKIEKTLLAEERKFIAQFYVDCSYGYMLTRYAHDESERKRLQKLLIRAGLLPSDRRTPSLDLNWVSSTSY